MSCIDQQISEKYPPYHAHDHMTQRLGTEEYRN